MKRTVDLENILKVAFFPEESNVNGNRPIFIRILKTLDILDITSSLSNATLFCNILICDQQGPRINTKLYSPWEAAPTLFVYFGFPIIGNITPLLLYWAPIQKSSTNWKFYYLLKLKDSHAVCASIILFHKTFITITI